MKSCCLFLMMLFSAAVGAQKPVLNHIAHHVTNLQQSTRFYQEVIGLDTIPEPFRDGKHTWFSIGPRIHLHLIAGATGSGEKNKNSHLCFTVPSVEQFAKKLVQAGVAYEDWPGTAGAVTTRADGVKQIYFKDPDGYWIEVNDARE